jgi:hypothetical protein
MTSTSSITASRRRSPHMLLSPGQRLGSAVPTSLAQRDTQVLERSHAQPPRDAQGGVDMGIGRGVPWPVPVQQSSELNVGHRLERWAAHCIAHRQH